ncbi:hypothetical protein CRUP_013702 [Coryphaenoides rupestris]|nr:hypothetical protein CRUP_013702 [Coryphaenoides rupestris]
MGPERVSDEQAGSSSKSPPSTHPPPLPPPYLHPTSPTSTLTSTPTSPTSTLPPLPPPYLPPTSTLPPLPPPYLPYLPLPPPHRRLPPCLRSAGWMEAIFPPGKTHGLACKRKEQEQHKDRNLAPKKQRLVFTDLQRRTLIAIFKENKRPSKEMQITISQQLGLELNTVSNFFMNARRRCVDRWHDDHHGGSPGQPGTSAPPTSFSKA